MKLHNLAKSPSAVKKGSEIRITLTTAKGKKANTLILQDDGDVSWLHDEAEAATALLIPNHIRSNRTWLIKIAFDADKVYSQLCDADALLSLGDNVLMTTESLKSCATRYEQSHKLYYQQYRFDTLDALRGVDAKAVLCDMLVSDFINSHQDADRLTFEQILEHCGAEEISTLWRPVESLLDRESLPAFPVAELGATLGQLASDISRITNTEAGMAGSVSLSIVAHCNLNCSLNGLPLNMYVLGVAESAGHKSNILRFLKKPIDEQYEKECEAWQRLDAESEEETPKPFKNFFGGSRVSVQGIANELAHDNCSMFTPEAVAFFDGYGFSESNRHTASVLASMFSAEDVDTVLAKGRTVLPAGRRLNACLLGQVSALDSLLRNESALEIGLSARFLIHKQPKIDFNIERTYQPLTDLLSNEFGGGAAGAYYERIREMLQSRNQRKELHLDNEAQSLINKMYRDYNLWLGDKHPRYTVNNNEIIKTFVLRMAEHATRIAGNLFLFDNPTGNRVGVEYIEKGRRLVEYYYEMLVALASVDQSRDVYDRLMVGIFERQAKGKCKTVAEVRQAKILRDPNDSQKALDSQKLNDILMTLEQNGFIKLFKPTDGTTSDIVKLHPDYDPIAKARRR